MRKLFAPLHSLRLRIPLLTAVIILLLTGGTGWLALGQFDTAITQQLEHEAILMADTFNAGITSYADLENSAGLQQVINNLVEARQSAIEINITLLQGDGSTSAIVASTEQQNIGMTSDAEHTALLQVLDSSKPVIKIFPQQDPITASDNTSTTQTRLTRYLNVTAPWQIKGKTAGAVDLKISLLDLDQQISTARSHLYLILLGEILLAFLVLGLMLHVSILRPLESMNQKMYQIAGGEYGQRLDSAKRKDEIGQTSQVFNYMSEQLQRLQQQVQLYLNPLAAEAAYRQALETSPLNFPETQQLTVLFVDIVNFTGFSEYLEPKKTVAFLNYYLDLIASELVQVNGQINKFIADEAVCIFDGPQHAQRAINAGQAILRVLQERPADFPPAEVRIGINSGECIVADVGSVSIRQFERTIIGDTVNVAQRLMTVAQPNSIVLSEETEMMLTPNQYQVIHLGQLALKGKSTKISAYQLMGN